MESEISRNIPQRRNQRKRRIDSISDGVRDRGRNNNDEPIHIASDEERNDTPEVIDLENETEDEVEIVDVNTRNPTPIVQIQNNDNPQDVEITGSRFVPSPSPLNMSHEEAMILNTMSLPPEDMYTFDQVLRHHQQIYHNLLRRHHQHMNNVTPRSRPRRRINNPRQLRARFPVADYQPQPEDYHLFYQDSTDEDNDVVSSSILQRIEEDNNNMVNDRFTKERKYNQKQMMDKKKAAQEMDEQHTSNIEKNTNLVCELCNCVLGSGIDSEFKPELKLQTNLEKFQVQYKVQAPWFCSKLLTEVDADLSRRIFASSCGHLYCGRCVKNIGNRPRATKATPKSNVIDNPKIYAPSKCVAHGCTKKFTAKTFTELYF